MTKKQCLRYYGGTARHIADALGLTKSSVNKWGKYPPAQWQCVIQVMTGGRLESEMHKKLKPDRFRMPADRQEQ